ncbi:hypothetical protein TrVE_jg7613 [Triparma verrucosa]|uniref:BART domain-containing protein n=1 Tax=Triparma verrucosa TaxID=1606542 RepID=A0A9W7F0A3_9STRA|nr:hypothetical protein TrVE_jg7613 [Triparma verrucosa]
MPSSSSSSSLTFSEGVGGGNLPLHSVVGDLLSHFTLSTVRNRITTFMVENSRVFESLSPEKDDPDYPIECHDIYLSYERMFSKELETFCSLQNITEEKLVNVLHDAYDRSPKWSNRVEGKCDDDDDDGDDDDDVDGEESEEKLIVRYLLAALDPKTFFELARKEAAITLKAREDCSYF